MRQVPLIDRLLLWLFGVARNLFFLQGLAFGCASATTFAWTRSDVSPWLTRSLVVAALISGTFVVAGFLLSWMRSWTPTRDRWSDPAESVWPTRLTGSLVVISGLTVIVSGGLPGLWRQILAQLSAIDFWNGLTTPSQFGGIVILPILLALFVPLLVTVAAVFSFCSRWSCSPDCGPAADVSNDAVDGRRVPVRARRDGFDGNDVVARADAGFKRSHVGGPRRRSGAGGRSADTGDERADDHGDDARPASGGAGGVGCVSAALQ